LFGHQSLKSGERNGGGSREPPQRLFKEDDNVIFFAFPEAVQRIMYTTNAIEALNAKLRRAVKIRGHFPTGEAAMKLIYLVLRRAAGGWKMPPKEWSQAKTQFAIMFEDKFLA
jgi:putative transposase